MFKYPKNVKKDTFFKHLIKERKHIAVIIESTLNNQICYDVFHSINDYLPNEIGATIFSQDWKTPTIIPPTAHYHITDLKLFRGNAIATSVSCVFDALNIPTIENIIWYIYDISELQIYKKEDLELFLTSKRIKTVCRSEKHKKIIEGNYLQNNNIADIEMTNFDMSELSKLLY